MNSFIQQFQARSKPCMIGPAMQTAAGSENDLQKASKLPAGDVGRYKPTWIRARSWGQAHFKHNNCNNAK